MSKYNLSQPITIDLKSNDLFINDELTLPNSRSIIYGKNGTGKSTLTDIIRQQFSSKSEILCFQGFEKIIGESRKLNAIVLGEKNTEINIQIDRIEEEKKQIEEQKKNILSQIEKNEDKDSLYCKKTSLDEIIRKENKELESNYSTSAAIIKNMNNPRIALTTYNKNHFIADIQYAKLLSDDEYSKCCILQKEDIKTASKVSLSEYSFDTLITDVNELRNTVVEETVIINRLEGNSAKKQFAEAGLSLHTSGDICAFCGNTITDKTIKELTSYFSADKVKELQNKLVEHIKSIELIKREINEIDLTDLNFYSYMKSEINLIINEFNNLKQDNIQYLDYLLNALKDKQIDLFTRLDNLEKDPPATLAGIITSYNTCVNKNNKSDLETSKIDAQKKLRLHKVKQELDKMKYVDAEQSINISVAKRDEIIQLINIEKDKIEGKNGLDVKIQSIDCEIMRLKSQTISETKLAEEINKKLKRLVNFEIVHHQSPDNNNYYVIKSLQNNKIRDVDELSTGEKNIIAFLYFIGKINEFRDQPNDNNQILIFDDPMNSNDDVMQYLIIEELEKVMRNTVNPNVIIILTHNKHFYLNVQPYNSYKDYSLFHLQSIDYKTQIITIDKKENDFKTSYDSLWYELKTLYEANNVSADVLLNPIRRIVETYTKFNSINKKNFTNKALGAEKLFNVNSHSIDDLEAELNGQTKDDIIILLKDCFDRNNASDHFEAHWITK